MCAVRLSRYYISLLFRKEIIADILKDFSTYRQVTARFMNRQNCFNLFLAVPYYFVLLFLMLILSVYIQGVPRILYLSFRAS